MSALGGSMFPRFLMSATMQKIGLVTFNAWALDGYMKVFWRGAPSGAVAAGSGARRPDGRVPGAARASSPGAGKRL